MTKADFSNRRTPAEARGGFTLIELLLVLVILLALAGIIIPNFAKRPEQARITAAVVEISNIETMLDTFNFDCGRFPKTQEGVRALVEQPSDAEDWKGPYLKRGVPKDPWGNEYVYQYPGQNNTSSYDLYSYGPDGEEGGGDDIDNWSEE